MTNGTMIDEEDKDHQTPLMLAVNRGQVSSYLIKHDADVTKKLPNGETAFHLANRTGSLELVELLVTNGAKIDDQD